MEIANCWGTEGEEELLHRKWRKRKKKAFFSWIVSQASIIKQQADGCNATPFLQKSQWSHFGSVNSCQIFPFFFPASSVGAAGQSLPVALLQMMQFDRNHMKSLVLGHGVARGLERGGSTQWSCTQSVSAPSHWLVPNVPCLSKAALMELSTNQKIIIILKRKKSNERNTFYHCQSGHLLLCCFQNLLGFAF